MFTVGLTEADKEEKIEKDQLTLVTESLCPPCWTERQQKTQDDVTTACSYVTTHRPIILIPDEVKKQKVKKKK